MPAVEASYVAFRHNDELKALYCVDGQFQAKQPLALALEPGVYGLNVKITTVGDSEQDDFYLNLMIPVDEILQVLQGLKKFPPGLTKIDPNTVFI